MWRWLAGLVVLLFVLWLVLNLARVIFGGLIHLLWIGIVVLAIIAIWNALTARRTPTGGAA